MQPIKGPSPRDWPPWPPCGRYVALQRIVQGIVPAQKVLFHYLDDFLILRGCWRELEEVTRCVVQALRDAGLLVSPKSVLEPTTCILFLGTRIDTFKKKIWSHPRAFLQKFAQWVWLATAPHPDIRHLNEVLGFIQWHVHLRKGMGPYNQAQ